MNTYIFKSRLQQNFLRNKRNSLKNTKKVKVKKAPSSRNSLNHSRNRIGYANLFLLIAKLIYFLLLLSSMFDPKTNKFPYPIDTASHVDPDDVEMLEDLVASAVGDALNKITEDEKAKLPNLGM